MKNDQFFKFVAVIIIAGVFVALASPFTQASAAADAATNAAATLTQAAHSTE